MQRTEAGLAQLCFLFRNYLLSLQLTSPLFQQRRNFAPLWLGLLPRIHEPKDHRLAICRAYDIQAERSPAFVQMT